MTGAEAPGACRTFALCEVCCQTAPRRSFSRCCAVGMCAAEEDRPGAAGGLDVETTVEAKTAGPLSGNRTRHLLSQFFDFALLASGLGLGSWERLAFHPVRLCGRWWQSGLREGGAWNLPWRVDIFDSMGYAGGLIRVNFCDRRFWASKSRGKPCKLLKIR